MDADSNQKNVTLPVLALRDLVVFPNLITSLLVKRTQSINAVNYASEHEQKILIVTQKQLNNTPESLEDVYAVGTIATIIQKISSENDALKVLIDSEEQIQLSEFFHRDNAFFANYKPFKLKHDLSEGKVLVYLKSVLEAFKDYAQLSGKINEETLNHALTITSLTHAINFIATHIPSLLVQKQALLEQNIMSVRAENLLRLIEEEIDIIETEKRIRGRIKQQIEKNQREYFLNEQIKVVTKELDELNGGSLSELDSLKAKIEAAKMPKEVEEKALQEWKKLKTMPAMSAEATVIRNYLDWFLKMPWQTKSKLKKDLDFARDCLDADHFGLEKIKERILEYLAVQMHSSSLKTPVICFVGPPGIGKTTLARSIAKATGREFTRMSLGGVKDESEIRGHRRTYIGAMPGRIIQMLTKVKTRNPVILLDEIDKMGNDFRGDPASALLEVLDAEQNNKFNDHYLDIDVDLSKVMFIATANSYNIPAPLRDRMEVISLSGYTELEKFDIAKRHLIPKQLKEHAIKPEEIQITDDAITQLIRAYTKEAGVRGLEREVAKLARKALMKILAQKSEAKKKKGTTSSLKSKKPSNLKITVKNLNEYLGVERFKHGTKEAKDHIGFVNGLAWTEVGGELLGIEVEVMPGKGQLTFTGSLGNVMKESMQTAISVARIRAQSLGLPYNFHEKWDIHVHAPEGATPKDGPSAGIAITTAIISALTGNPIKADLAMTGEVTLRGNVLAIGGLKEKLLAAIRGGIKTVIIPKQNEKDIVELPSEIVKNLLILNVEHIDEVLSLALTQAIDLKYNNINPLTFSQPVEGKEAYQ